MWVASDNLKLLRKVKTMEYGKMVQLVMEQFGCDRDEANLRIAVAFYVLADNKLVTRVANHFETAKERN